MVKPYEEEQAKTLSEREANTLLTIFFRYIEDTYKQSRWEVEAMGADYGRIRTGFQSKIGDIIIEVRTACVEEGIVKVVISSDGVLISDQNFPINGKSPRELGNLTRNMFKWVKQQMDEL